MRSKCIIFGALAPHLEDFGKAHTRIARGARCPTKRKRSMSTDSIALSSERVETIFKDCLFRDGEDTSEHIVAEGIIRNVGFHPGRIKEHHQEIHDLLAELPDTFRDSGWSFLNACMDKHGNQWADLHRTMEQLVQLGIAIEEVEYCVPRDAWSLLPGGMPYFKVKQ